MRKLLLCLAATVLSCVYCDSSYGAGKIQVRLKSLAGKSFLSRVRINSAVQDTYHRKTTSRISRFNFVNRLTFSRSPLPGFTRVTLQFLAVDIDMRLGKDRLIMDSRHPEENSRDTKFPGGALMIASFKALVGQKLVYDLAPNATVVRTIGLESVLRDIASKASSGRQGKINPSYFRDVVSYSSLTESLDESPSLLLPLPQKRVRRGDSWTVTQGVTGSSAQSPTKSIYTVLNMNGKRITAGIKAYRVNRSYGPGYTESMSRTGSAQLDIQTGLTVALQSTEHRKLGAKRGASSDSFSSDSTVHKESTVQPILPKMR